MTPLSLFGLVLMALGGLGLVTTFFFYPLWTAVAHRLAGTRPVARRDDGPLPTVTAIVAFRGGGEALRRKVDNLLALDDDNGKLDVVLVVDGPATDQAEYLPEAFRKRGWRLLDLPASKGKNAALNLGIEHARGELLMFTDLDGDLPSDTLRRAAAWFADPAVGGICGNRVIGTTETDLSGAQSTYVSWDRRIKEGESRCGYLSSNEGKLSLFRRAAVGPIAEAVTDDLFNGVAVQLQGLRLVFDPALTVTIGKPSRSLEHELERRRRIVARSLNCLFVLRAAFHPGTGMLGIGLMINKVFRRIAPLFGLMAATGAALASPTWPWLAAVPAALLAAVALAVLGPSVERIGLPEPIEKIRRLGLYVLYGNLGMFLGTWDFLRGKRVSEWTPNKTP